ncbi:hypothetical protein EYF80_033330 [Liparis tanakae]|uniref:Uncharacterized protein n=1 Tax=Liparis tanakae TaxID=230148 RepID=A0A4Z2GT85_9TELE|nr:hypothetical protein EYF80_033330 [Liparis tanakae]
MTGTPLEKRRPQSGNARLEDGGRRVSIVEDGCKETYGVTVSMKEGKTPPEESAERNPTRDASQGVAPRSVVHREQWNPLHPDRGTSLSPDNPKPNTASLNLQLRHQKRILR